jgi:outer membrane protein assembly factor BamB
LRLCASISLDPELAIADTTPTCYSSHPNRPFSEIVSMIKRISIAVFCNLAIMTFAPAQEFSGWRTDGTGRYPKADPPTVWGPDKNVVWKVKMPGFSVSTPVILGDKIVVGCERTTLFCFNKADGTVLWRKPSTYSDVPWSHDDKEKLKAERAQSAVWGKEQQGLEKQLNVLEKTLKDEPDNTKELKVQRDALRKQVDELRKKRQTLPLLMRATEPGQHGTAGYSPGTPVSNGKQVFVAYGNGLVACHDLDGTRRWLTLMEHSSAAFGHGSSPMLAGDKVIVHYADLVALNIKDGSESWRLKLPPLHGTSIPTRIGDTEVILTPTGHMIRVADGKILADKLGLCGENSPILHDGIAYFIAGNSTAVRLPASIDDKVVPLWKGKLKGGGYWFASPIYHDGLLYAVQQNRSFSVVDARTGKLVYFEKLDCGGDAYPSVCLAGKYIYVSSDNGTTIVLEPGREYKEVARNTLETFRSSPVFEGRRMYVRSQNYLWCIGE